MATNLKTKKQEVFKYVELNLGGGMIDVELDPDHYETALGAALAKFRQRSDNSVEESYMFLPTVIDQNEYTLPTEVVEVRQEVREKNNVMDDPTQSIESIRQNINESHTTILNDLEETEIKADSTDELKSRVASLLQAFLEIEMDNKSTINLSYEEVMKKVNRSKQREKQSIIEYLGNMSKEERKVEELFKMYKLGRWNVGQQKGLVSYDKDTYERERDELLIQLQNDESTKQYEAVSEMRREIFDLEKDEEDQQNEFYEQEANDIGHLDEDYADGHFYPDDVENIDD